MRQEVKVRSSSLASPPTTVAGRPQALASPGHLRRLFPASAAGRQAIAATRDGAEAIVAARDDRLLVVVGPCSIHDPVAARHYAAELAPLAEKHEEELLLVMRTYLEKPRTKVGWKGFVNDPKLDGSCDLAAGLEAARSLLVAIADTGLGAASEVIDPAVAPYIEDLLSWVAIGARTSESQLHRELASGLPMPVGFKNGTDGDMEGALCAMVAAASPHTRMTIDREGRAAVVRTPGNRSLHLVLRGGRTGPNHTEAHLRTTSVRAHSHGLLPRVMIDCSHQNSGKRYERQPQIVADVCAQVAAGDGNLIGVMLESHLVAGRQDLTPGKSLTYGQSVTDGCIDLADTAACLEALATAVRARRGL
ncbi:MAG: 3-deoxy-7-phosphoheptulonate synthase [Myxococcales bacterium]|nr:3-deoxy-7-phosphoheptulonate synthase [Myxococcales bacterium]